MPRSSDPFAIAGVIALAVRDYPSLVSRSFIALSISVSRIPGVVISSGSHGFIAHELRGYREGHWCFSLVLNRNWIRLYIRSPELGRGAVCYNQFKLAFPTAEVTTKGEIALNISDENLTKAVCDWMEYA